VIPDNLTLGDFQVSSDLDGARIAPRKPSPLQSQTQVLMGFSAEKPIAAPKTELITSRKSSPLLLFHPLTASFNSAHQLPEVLTFAISEQRP
jgi:hypothetical protein